MFDLVIDAVALDDLLAQYFQSDNRNYPVFQTSRHLSPKVVQQINRIVRTHEQEVAKNVIVASALAFVELAYKWKRGELKVSTFTSYQLGGFLQETPSWFVVDPVDEDTLLDMGSVPSTVTMPDGKEAAIEWTDAIHIATMLGRDSARLITSDRKLLQITGEGA